MRIHSTEKQSYVNGPGRRAVLFLQGCPIHCPGCQNRALWPAQGGEEVDLQALAGYMAALAADTNGLVTISGGEPFAQPLGLAVLVGLLKRAYGVRHIVVYSGYTIEQLCQPDHPARPFLPQIFSYIDVLVDGPYIARLDDPFLSHRGSRNQRPIDIPATLRAGGELVLLDWDGIEVVITPTGDALMPAGMAGSLGAALGSSVPQLRCGER